MVAIKALFMKESAAKTALANLAETLPESPEGSQRILCCAAENSGRGIAFETCHLCEKEHGIV
jgi:lauroyl/myristoyl acyltransferase